MTTEPEAGVFRLNHLCANCLKPLRVDESIHAHYCDQCRRDGVIQAVNRKRANARHRTLIGRFGQARATAKHRGIEWALSREQYEALLAPGTCHYCAGPLSETGGGLDRLDNAQGYRMGNVVPACWVCNTVRGVVFTESEMRRIGVVIKEIVSDWPAARCRRWHSH